MYQIVEECSCQLKVLGSYQSWSEAEEAAAILEQCGIQTRIIHTSKDKENYEKK